MRYEDLRDSFYDARRTLDHKDSHYLRKSRTWDFISEYPETDDIVEFVSQIIEYFCVKDGTFQKKAYGGYLIATYILREHHYQLNSNVDQNAAAAQLVSTPNLDSEIIADWIDEHYECIYQSPPPF